MSLAISRRGHLRCFPRRSTRQVSCIETWTKTQTPWLNQAANAAVKAKGTIFAIVYRRLVPRLGHAQAIGAITHRLCRLIWKILHQTVRYEERGPAVSVEAKKVRTRKMIRELRTLGYRIELISQAPVA
jgi:hypothetical protein